MLITTFEEVKDEITARTSWTSLAFIYFQKEKPQTE